MAWPLPAGTWRVSRGLSRTHEGIDLAPTTTAAIPVYAARGGYVAFAGWGDRAPAALHVRGGGWCVVITQGARMQIQQGYAHLAAPGPRVTTGIQVAEGQLLGYMGATGNASGRHLHWQWREDGKWIDPRSRITEPGSGAGASDPRDRPSSPYDVAKREYYRAAGGVARTLAGSWFNPLPGGDIGAVDKLAQAIVAQWTCELPRPLSWPPRWNNPGNVTVGWCRDLGESRPAAVGSPSNGGNPIAQCRSPADGVELYSRGLQRFARYEGARAAARAGDPEGFIRAVTGAGYGTRADCTLTEYARLVKEGPPLNIDPGALVESATAGLEGVIAGLPAAIFDQTLRPALYLVALAVLVLLGGYMVVTGIDQPTRAIPRAIRATVRTSAKGVRIADRAVRAAGSVP